MLFQYYITCFSLVSDNFTFWKAIFHTFMTSCYKILFGLRLAIMHSGSSLRSASVFSFLLGFAKYLEAFSSAFLLS
jgi:hypothetical protein